MQTLKHIHGYLFDIFEKKKIQEIINILTEKLGPGKEQPIAITVLGSGKNVRQNKRYWKIDNIQEAFDVIESICKERFPTDVSVLRNTIKNFEIITIETEELPYSLLLIYIKIDEKKIELEKLFTTMEKILHPFRIYLEEYSGIVRGLFPSKPICPYFIDVAIQSSHEEIKSMVQTAVEISESDSIPNESIMADYLLSRSATIRKNPPLSNLPYAFNLLSIPSMFGNQISFVGHIQQPALNGLMTAFAVTYYENDNWPDVIDPNSFLTINANGYDGMLNSWNHAGTIIYLLTMYAWLSYFDRVVVKLESDFIVLRKNIQKFLADGNEESLEEYLAKLDKNGSEIVNLISEMGQLKRHSERTIRDFINGRSISTVEIPITPSTKSDFYFWNEFKEKNGSGAYLQNIALKIDGLMTKTRAVLEQYNYENEKLHNHVNNLVNLRVQHTMKHHSTIMLYATIAIGVLAFATVILSIQDGVALDEIKNITNRQFAIENSYSTKIVPNLVFLSTGNYHSYYTKGINVTALGNHPINFQIINASVYVADLGKCFFASDTKPTLELSSGVDATVKDQTTTLVPMLYGNYEVSSPFFWYNNDKGGYFTIGNVYFDILVTDESNPIPQNKIIESDLVVRLPQDAQEKFSNCG